MDKESFVISKFENSFNGDDGAVVGKWVFSKDLFCENVHFRRDYMSLREIAAKSMLVAPKLFPVVVVKSVLVAPKFYPRRSSVIRT